MRDTQVAYETTLPIPVDGDPTERTPTSTSSGARRVPRVARRKRFGLVGALLAFASVAAAAVWAMGRPGSPAPAPQPPHSLSSSLSAAQAAASARPHSELIASGAGGVTVVPVASAAASVTARTAAPITVTSNHRAASISKPIKPDPQPAAVSSATAPTTDLGSEIGPSVEIEKLIEKRH
jgi:hypothetical protein